MPQVTIRWGPSSLFHCESTKLALLNTLQNLGDCGSRASLNDTFCWMLSELVFEAKEKVRGENQLRFILADQTLFLWHDALPPAFLQSSLLSVSNILISAMYWADHMYGQLVISQKMFPKDKSCSQTIAPSFYTFLEWLRLCQKHNSILRVEANLNLFKMRLVRSGAAASTSQPSSTHLGLFSS